MRSEPILIAVCILLLALFAFGMYARVYGPVTLFQQDTKVQTLPVQEMRTTVQQPIVYNTIQNITQVIEHPVPIETAGDCIIINGDKKNIYCETP